MYYKNDETRIYSCETVTEVSVINNMSQTNKLGFENTTRPI